jgi:hypothetical protein
MPARVDAPIIHVFEREGEKMHGMGRARGRISRQRDVETCSHANMQPFNITTYTTEAHLWMIAAAGNKGGLRGRRTVHSPLACFVCAVLPRCPFRRRRSGQERTPIVLLYLRHNTAKLGMQVRRLCLIPAPERDEGTIAIHRCEGKQSQEGLLCDHRKKVRHPRIGAACGLSQNQIHPS